ncbi:transposable element Tcb2 transposase [Trichonephila clavipes]|nr:transposable element Tcb2 transposase [Trichonephila clavipes]
MDWPARSPDLNPIEHVWDFLGRRLAARTLPPVTIRELRLALQDEWAAMPQQLIDTLILSMGRRCETCLAVRRSYTLLKIGCFLLDTHHRDVSAFSRIALHATFSIKLLFIPLISLLIVLQCKKGDNHLVPGPDYMVDALKLSNLAPRFSGESLQTCVAWRCPDGTQHLFCWPILVISGRSLASNGSVVDSRYLNLMFSPTEATHNKLFLSSPTKYTVQPF